MMLEEIQIRSGITKVATLIGGHQKGWNDWDDAMRGHTDNDESKRMHGTKI